VKSRKGNGVSTARPERDVPEEAAETDKEKSRVEQVIEKVATGLGDVVGALADKGILFVVFALIWVAFGVALIWSQGSLDAAWQWVRDLPWLAQGLVWLLFLPVLAGLWIWETSWSLILRLGLIVSLAGWTLLIFPRPWK
jgi:hypothetical protein